MLTESSITEAVDLLVRHPPYLDSFRIVEAALDDLERYERQKVITAEVRQRLVEKLMLSSHCLNR